MAVYLKSLAQPRPPAAETSNIPGFESSLLVTLGKTIYDNQCAVCHGPEGSESRRTFRRSPAISRSRWKSAVNPIRMVLNGGYPPGTSGNPMPYGMPPFAQSLSDDEVAAVVTYIRTAWGNRGDSSQRAAMRIACVPLRLIEASDDQFATVPSGAEEARDADIEAIVESGPRGAIALAGIATCWSWRSGLRSIFLSLRRER